MNLKLPEFKKKLNLNEVLIAGEKTVHSFGTCTLTDRRLISLEGKSNLRSMELNKIEMISMSKKQKKLLLIIAVIAACGSIILLFYGGMRAIAILLFMAAAGLLIGYILSIKEVVTFHTAGNKISTMSGTGASKFLSKVEESMSKKR